jgi:hypothetical protein
MSLASKLQEERAELKVKILVVTARYALDALTHDVDAKTKHAAVDNLRRALEPFEGAP